MADEQPRYRSYVLRLWEVRSGGGRACRASLHSPGSGERHAFADLQSLFRFLKRTMREPIEPQSPRHPKDDA
jgi:hypothetical protein